MSVPDELTRFGRQQERLEAIKAADLVEEGGELRRRLAAAEFATSPEPAG